MFFIGRAQFEVTECIKGAVCWYCLSKRSHLNSLHNHYKPQVIQQCMCNFNMMICGKEQSQVKFM